MSKAAHYFQNCAALILLLVAHAIDSSGPEPKAPIVSLLLPKIAQGSTASQGEFPFVVQVRPMISFTNMMCGGSIISSNLIVTAAHCLDGITVLDESQGYKVQILAGDTRWGYVAGSQVRSVRTIIQHHNYRSSTLKNDVAILVLSEHLTYDRWVKPIQLPDSGQSFSGTAEICGWGREGGDREHVPSNLQKAHLPLQSATRCSQLGGYDNEVMMCAGGAGTDTCKGDSGGPLICTVGSQQYLCGITSWGHGCGTPGVPGVYARVSIYTSWLRSKIQEHGTQAGGGTGTTQSGSCAAGQLICDQTNKCINSTYVCDGDNDCGNGSDEFGCGSCGSDRFKCAKSDKCISWSWICDGDNDCKDGSDETGCGDCAADKFRCTGGKCVKKNFVCDGDNDCGNGSDEVGCGQCDRDKFKCATSGKCISSSWICDGDNDCQDGSDESGCGDCAADKFRCSTTGTCIKKNFVCDGDNDCGNGSDEYGCGQCGRDKFKCATSDKCVSTSWVCDGDNDCGDGSDETGCGGCPGDKFRCGIGTCEKRAWVCDGTDDCGDGSDEKGCACAV